MSNTNNWDVIVVGGGAAGFFGAIVSSTTGLRVTILEASIKPLIKVGISGGGRCNVTHHCFDPSQLVNNYPRGGKALRGAFSRFQPQDTVEWFQSRGVKLKTEKDGRMFPITDNSQTIIDCLVTTAKKTGIILQTKSFVQSVVIDEIDNDYKFKIQLKSDRELRCKFLLIATGSSPLGYTWAKNLGHTIERPVPSLFTFKVTDSRIKNLAGVSVDRAEVSLLGIGKNKLSQKGSLLITHWGFSGPAILKLSAWGARVLFENNYNLLLQVNWLGDYNMESLKLDLLDIKYSMSKKKIINYSPFNLPKRLWQSIVSYVGIKPEKTWLEISKKELNKLAMELVGGQYKIQGKGVFKEEFVTCGGVNLKEINFKTMESKLCPGLYFAGEVLDIDGVTGGFNFQSAWTTGYLAGNAIVNN